MPVRRFALLCGLFCALPAAAPAAAQDPERVPSGVSAGGVDLSNLTLDEARIRLELVIGSRIAPDLILGAAGKPWKLTMARAKLRFDALTTAKRALRAQPPPQPPQGGGGATPGTLVALALTHSRLAVKAFVDKVAKATYHAPRDATLRIGLRKLRLRRARPGKAIDVEAVVKLVDDALANESAPRVLHTRLVRVSPRVNADDLHRTYRTVITIDRANFKLRLFKDFKLRKTYGVAVGQPAYPTPTGLFQIQDKQVNPVWSVPNSPWAGELAGTTVAGGSFANPLKARWMGIANGVGIHGTGQEWSIGSRASHGCIRMRVADVVDLFPRVSLGTTVKIR